MQGLHIGYAGVYNYIHNPQTLIPRYIKPGGYLTDMWLFTALDGTPRNTGTTSNLK